MTNTLPPILGTATQRDRGEPFGGTRALDAARQDFIDSLADIRTQQAGDLLRRIRLARSLRELWFLRAEVFHLVAHHRDQSEANHRMALLGTHFPRQVPNTPSHRRAGGRS